MRIALFGSKPYDRRFFQTANESYGFDIDFVEANLKLETVVLAQGSDAVCAFVNDVLDEPTLRRLKESGTRFVQMRCAGFNNVDLDAAKRLGLRIGRVPEYSPYAVAEHALALILGLNRKVHRAYNRVREGNFALDGLMGFDLRGSVVGVVGTGRIGRIFGSLMQGVGCSVLAYDLYPNDEFKASGAEYVSLEELFERSRIISLHCPLTPETHHLIDERAIGQMRDGVMIINTSRGALVKTSALIAGLKSGKVGHVGLDVYEEEADLFFEDLSSEVIKDDVFARLTTFPNVLITGHQAFFTREAMVRIAQTSLENLSAFATGEPCPNELTVVEGSSRG